MSLQEDAIKFKEKILPLIESAAKGEKLIAGQDIEINSLVFNIFVAKPVHGVFALADFDHTAVKSEKR